MNTEKAALSAIPNFIGTLPKTLVQNGARRLRETEKTMYYDVYCTSQRPAHEERDREVFRSLIVQWPLATEGFFLYCLPSNASHIVSWMVLESPQQFKTRG